MEKRSLKAFDDLVYGVFLCCVLTLFVTFSGLGLWFFWLLDGYDRGFDDLHEKGLLLLWTLFCAYKAPELLGKLFDNRPSKRTNLDIDLEG